MRRDLVVVRTEGWRIYAYDSSAKNQNALLRQVDETYPLKGRKPLTLASVLKKKIQPAFKSIALPILASCKSLK